MAAACLAVGPGALASHRTAAAAQVLVAHPQPVEIVLPYGRAAPPGA